MIVDFLLSLLEDFLKGDISKIIKAGMYWKIVKKMVKQCKVSENLKKIVKSA